MTTRTPYVSRIRGSVCPPVTKASLPVSQPNSASSAALEDFPSTTRSTPVRFRSSVALTCLLAASMSVNDPFRSSTVKSRAIAGSFSGAAAGSFMGFLGPSQFRIIPFQTSKLDKDNVGKVVPGCSIAEKSHSGAGIPAASLTQRQPEPLFLIDVDQP